MNTIKPTLTLFVIALVTAVLVSIVYEFTLEPIEQIRMQRERDTVAAMLPGTVDTSYTEVEGLPSLTRLITGYNEQGERIGYVVSAFGPGYAGPVSIMVSFDLEGSLTGVQVVRQSETPGLGTAILEPEFLGQFVGREGPLRVTRVYSGGADEIAALASATISTEAVVRGVNAALEFIENIMGEVTQ